MGQLLDLLGAWCRVIYARAYEGDEVLIRTQGLGSNAPLLQACQHLEQQATSLETAAAPLFQTTTASKVHFSTRLSPHQHPLRALTSTQLAEMSSGQPGNLFLTEPQVTSDFLDRLRQMKARMNGLKTQVETVRGFPCLGAVSPCCQACYFCQRALQQHLMP